MKADRLKTVQSIIILSLVLYISSIQCPSGFDSVPLGSPFGQCMILGCSKSTPNQPCNQQCVAGFSKTQQKSCEVINCVSESKTRCESCERGYQLQVDTSNPQIRVCVPANCQSYDKITRKCQRCAIGYQLHKNGVCYLANCQQSVSQSSQCLRCLTGYSLTQIQLGINVCLPQNCQSYSKQTYQCLQCQNLYMKQQLTGLCKSGVKNCINYSQISGLCYQCSDGYKLVGLKNCIKQDKTCQQYGMQGCITCKPPYKPINGKCYPNNCLQYDKQNTNICKSCDIGYKLNAIDKICEVQNCELFDKQKYRCGKCLDTHMAYYLPSYSTPNINVQRCITKNCQVYHNKAYKCLKCNGEYQLLDGDCVLRNCQNPRAVQCNKCIDGWRVNIRLNCVQYDCLQYDTQQKCKTCAIGKRFYKGMCLTDNCKTRKPDGTCGECLGQLIVDTKYPKYCVTPFCKKVDQTSGDCLECYNSFRLNNKGICQTAVCQQYQIKQKQTTLCKKCQDGYQLKNNYCIPSTKYCSQYNMEDGRCTKCTQNYQLNPKSNKCVPSKCRNFQQKSTYSICLDCNLGYSLVNQANDIQKCAVANCSKLDQGVCKQCVKGYSILGDICLADNCLDFTLDGRCKTCNQGFKFNSNTLTCSRIRCKQQNRQTCLKCQDNHYPDTEQSASKGLCRPYNCQNFIYENDQQVKCIKCGQGFVYMQDSKKCIASDCAQIDLGTGSCRDCRPGFQLRNDGRCYYVRNNGYCPDKKYAIADFTCQSMRAQKCLSANPANTALCYRCQNNYFLKDGKCLAYQHCPVQNRNPYLGCVKCDNGYQVGKTGACQSSVPNCIQFDGASGECQQCDNGYQLIVYPTKNCKRVPDYCVGLDPWGYCTQCRDSARSLSPQKLCIYATNMCTKYDMNTGYCAECEQGNFLWTDYINPTSCRPNPPNCQAVSNKGQCTKCSGDLVLNQGLCFPPIKNCIAYNRNQCTRCQANFFIQSSTGRCKQLPRYCDKIVLNTDGICEQCRAGYANANGTCVRKIQFCASYDTSTGRCASCIGGYSLAASRMLCLIGSF